LPDASDACIGLALSAGHAEVLSTIDPEAIDPFTSTGDVVCAEGEVRTLFITFAGDQSGTHRPINAVKLFICPTGTFEVHLRVTLDFETNGTNGTWSVAPARRRSRRFTEQGTSSAPG
jgi:hypothetical protein